MPAIRAEAYGAKLRYLASAFVDAESIVPSVTHLTELLKILGGDQLLPVAFQEVSATGPTPRLAFAAPEGNVQLILLGKRFDYSYLAGEPEGADLGPLESFCQDAATKLIAVLNYFQRKAHRLAVVQEGYLSGLSPEDMNSIARRLLHLPPIYSEHIPYEWDWRAVSKFEREFGQLREQMNNITTVKRMQGLILRYGEGVASQVELDRVRLDFHINTLGTDTAARFEEDHLRRFFDDASAWHDALSSELVSFIFEGRQDGSNNPH